MDRSLTKRLKGVGVYKLDFSILSGKDLEILKSDNTNFNILQCNDDVLKVIGKLAGYTFNETKQAVLAYAQGVNGSLDDQIMVDSEETFMDFVSDEKNQLVEDKIGLEELRGTLIQFMSWLKPREAKVLIERYGLYDGRAKTLEEVGRLFGVTRERIRQIEAKSLKRLRLKLKGKTYNDII
jgi:RNA polymerase primary sigma factor